MERDALVRAATKVFEGYVGASPLSPDYPHEIYASPADFIDELLANLRDEAEVPRGLASEHEVGERPDEGIEAVRALP
jgi:hypothetical protein